MSIDNDENKEDEYEEIPIVLKLKKNVAEVARIFARCYHGERKEDFDKFISEEVPKIISSLSAAPPSPPEFPGSLKQHIQRLLLNKDTATANKGMEDLK